MFIVKRLYRERFYSPFMLFRYSRMN